MTRDQSFVELACLLGLDAGWATSEVDFTGQDPIVASPHRMGEATAAALAVQGLGVATIWRMRGGAPQRIAVDLADAIDALDTGRHLRQSSHSIGPHFTMSSPLSGFHRVADGRFIYMVGARARLRDGLLSLLDCPHEAGAIARALARWSAQDFEDACGERVLPGCKVRSADEWRAHPQGQWLARRPVVEVTRIGDSAPEPFEPGDRPLSGVRVLDVAHILAGPVSGRTLAEQGAEVLRITSPRIPDDFALVIDTGFGKRAAYLDFDTMSDRETMDTLVGGADVLIQSYRPGSLARRGLSPERLATIRPGIIYLDVSCYGGGPWSDRVGFDPNAQAATGVAATEGGSETPRTVPTGLLNDLLTGYLGAAGVMAALVRRAREGGSYEVSVSLARTAMWVQDLGLVDRADPSPARHDPRTAQMDSVFGRLEYLEPATRMSETSPHWELAPMPLGAAPAAWSQTE